MKRIAMIVGVAGVCAAAGAQPTFLAFESRNLYRTTGSGDLEVFDLGDEIVGGTVTPWGDIWVTSETGRSPMGDDLFELYRLDGATSAAPSLSLITDQLHTVYTTLVFVGDTLYSFQNGSQVLVTVDTATFAETVVGSTGIRQAGGGAYDPVSDTFWAANNLDNTLWTVPYADDPPTGVPVGLLGPDVLHLGMEYFEGELFLAAQNLDTGRFELGTVDTASGAFSSFMTLFDGATDGPVALVVIPSPGGLALLGFALAAASRRRR